MIKQKNKIFYQDNLITKFFIKSPKYGKFKVIIDTNDWDIINQYRWYPSLIGKYFYVVNHTTKKIILLHRLILKFPTRIVDHKNRNTLDNRKQNLRLCSRSENAQNATKHNHKTISKYKGVTWHKYAKKWMAQIALNNKHINLGYFNTEKKAALSYNQAAIQCFGDYANLNNIKSVLK